MMRFKKSLIFLPLVIFLVLLNHISWQRNDLGVMLTVDEIPIDVLGKIQNSINKLTRNCSNVVLLPDTHPKYLLAQNLIRNYSPPDSVSLDIAGAWSMNGWVLVEVEFKHLLPAVVIIQNADSVAEIVPDAIWSGYTNPHVPAPFIRNFLTEKIQSLPQSLIDCFEPQSKSFKSNNEK